MHHSRCFVKLIAGAATPGVKWPKPGENEQAICEHCGGKGNAFHMCYSCPRFEPQRRQQTSLELRQCAAALETDKQRESFAR
eukprot:5434790-Karenia_brevis.AAC.1